MLLHKQIEKLKSKGFIKERFNTILLLQAKGLKPKKIADKTNLSLKTVNKYLLYYEYYNSSHDYVSVNSKQEPYYKNEWQISWDSEEKGRYLYDIQRDIKQMFIIRGFNRKEERILHQFRLGKCRLNYYKYILKKHETGLCDNYNVFETIEHFILTCPRYDKQRRRMYRRIKIKNLNLKKLLGAK